MIKKKIKDGIVCKNIYFETICKIVLIIQVSLDIQLFNKIKLQAIINSTAQMMSQMICYHNSSERLYLSDVNDNNTNNIQ